MKNLLGTIVFVCVFLMMLAKCADDKLDESIKNGNNDVYYDSTVHKEVRDNSTTKTCIICSRKFERQKGYSKRRIGNDWVPFNGSKMGNSYCSYTCASKK